MIYKCTINSITIKLIQRIGIREELVIKISINMHCSNVDPGAA